MTAARCSVCQAPLVKYDAFTPELKAQGYLANGGLGMCRKHYAATRRANKLDDVARPRKRAVATSLTDVLDRYVEILERDITTKNADIARELHMRHTTLEKALNRGRNMGDPRARFREKRIQRSMSQVLDHYLASVTQDPWATNGDVAAKLGMTRAALEMALTRARRKGDERAVVRADLQREIILEDWEIIAPDHPQVRLNNGRIRDGWAEAIAKRIGVGTKQFVSVLQAAQADGDERARVYIDELRSA